MDDDPGHICSSLLRLCAICSTFTLPTFGCCCDSCTPFSYSSSAESIRLSSCVFIHLSFLSQWSRCMGKEAPGLHWSPGKPLSQPLTQHSCYLMSLADRNRLACQQSQLQGSLCRRVLCLCTLPPSKGCPRPCRSTACTSPCARLTVSSFPSAGPSDPHTEATPQKPPDI